LSRRLALNDLGERSTRAEAIAALRGAFAEAGVESYALDARLIACAAGRFSTADLICDPERALGESVARLKDMGARRASREPLSRILDEREFWGLKLALAPTVLDPRPDTETLVETALRAFAHRRNDHLRILDLGSGSGAILCALLSEFSSASGVALDVSPAAAAVSRANLEALGLDERAGVLVGRWCDALDGRFDIVVSNPPYIARPELAGLAPEVLRHDPLIALDGGADGLDAYRAIASALTRLVEPAAGWFFLEIGAGQEEDVSAILVANGMGRLGFERDLAGRVRVVQGRPSGSEPSF